MRRLCLFDVQFIVGQDHEYFELHSCPTSLLNIDARATKYPHLGDERTLHTWISTFRPRPARNLTQSGVVTPVPNMSWSWGKQPAASTSNVPRHEPKRTSTGPPRPIPFIPSSHLVSEAHDNATLAFNELNYFHPGYDLITKTSAGALTANLSQGQTFWITTSHSPNSNHQTKSLL